jgi:spermidine synthase
MARPRTRPGDPAAAAAPDPSSARAARFVPVLVFVSGATALVYQSLWLRSFGLVFGNTTDAVAMVLAVFMGGLGLGSLLAARHRAASPLAAYARVEAGIGVTALLTVPLLKALPAAYAALAARAGLGESVEAVGRGALAALVLLPTTVLLGATVPLVVEFLEQTRGDFPRSLGQTYLANTVGAAAGVYLGTFVLVPGFGVSGSLALSALGNLLVAGLAWQWSRPLAPTPPSARTGERARTPPLFAALAVVSGAFTFGIEVLWTRSFTLVIGSTVYAFSVMLLAVLVGLVIGSGLYAWLGPRIARPRTVLGALFAGTGAGALAGVVLIGRLPAAYLYLMGGLPPTFAAQQVAGFLLCLGTMLPVTAALGLSFPLLAHLIDGEIPAQQASGRLYLWNTLGAIVGALATDLVLIRTLGLQGSFVVLAGLPLVAGIATLAPSTSLRPHWRAAPAAVAALCLLALARGWRPWDPVAMTSGVYRYGPEWAASGVRLGDLARERRLLFYREGREAVVAVAERPHTTRRFLSINGKTDAGGGPEDVLQQKFVAHVPLLLHPAPRRVLVVGWGSGASTAAAALYPVETIECVEIEPATWEAAPLFDALSGEVRGDPRFRIVFRDGRNHLLRSRERWDVIVSEPSNVWIAGVANLFTRDFYEVARAKLAPNGLFAAWFHYYNMERADVMVELATFSAVFPHVSVWTVPPLPPELGGTLSADLLLVGSVEPHHLDWPRLEHAFRRTPVGDDLRATGVVEDELTLAASYAFGREDLLRLTDDRRSFPRGTPLNTDDQPWIEYRAGRHTALPPSVVRRLAQELHVALGEAAADPLPPFRDTSAPSGGGREAAVRVSALADRWARFGLPGRARRGLERALALDPTQEEVLERLGGMAIDAADWPRAEDLHRTLLRLRPRDVDAQLRLAAVLTRQAKWAQARDAFERARELDPRAPVDPRVLAYVTARVGTGAPAGARAPGPGPTSP